MKLTKEDLVRIQFALQTALTAQKSGVSIPVVSIRATLDKVEALLEKREVDGYLVSLCPHCLGGGCPECYEEEGK